VRRALLSLDELTSGQLAGTSPLIGGSGCITWVSLYETTGSNAAVCTLSDGPAAQGQGMMFYNILAGESTRDSSGLHRVPFVVGLFITVSSGSVGGAVVAWVDHDCEAYYRAKARAAKLAEAAELAEIGGL